MSVMVPKVALLCNILLASAALAVPFSNRLTTSHTTRSGLPALLISPYNAGSVIGNLSNGSITVITGTFTVPAVPTLSDTESEENITSIFLGIDGQAPCTGSFRAGFDISTTHTKVSYKAWGQWAHDDPKPFPSVMQAGDIVRLTVAGDSNTTGHAILENLTTGLTDKIEFYPPPSCPLCGTQALWLASSAIDGTQAPLADFGNVTFTDTGATGPENYVFIPSSALVMVMERDGQVVISAFTAGNRITFTTPG